MVVRSRKKSMTAGIIDSIRDKLEESNMTIRELADHVGVSDQYLYRVLRNEQVPSMQLLEKMVSGIGCTLVLVPE